jgi:subtilisin family serine protease
VGSTLDRDRFQDAMGRLHEVADFPVVYQPAEGGPDSMCFFSSAGPSATGVMKPDISAPGGLIVAAMSQDATPEVLGDSSPFHGTSGECGNDDPCFVVDASHGIMTGSSMSAPQVTGAIALLFERDPSLTQREILALLQQGARYPQGNVRFDYQLGVGALDVAGAMAAYDMRKTPIARDPVPEKSWMSLSSSYVHPDPAWPLTGLVSLRGEGGLIADGFDERRLSLTTSGPVQVTKPLSRVGPGLYRFEIAGATDGGGANAQIDVAFDARTIGISAGSSGHRILPIGADRWLAFGDVQSMGGCATKAPASQRGGWLALGVAFLTARARASRRTRAARKVVHRDRTAT